MSLQRFKLKPGMLILITSDGGYAPDAMDPELLIVTEWVGGFGADRVLAREIGNQPTAGVARVIGAEVYGDAVLVLDPERLAKYLDVLTKPPTHAFHSAEFYKVLMAAPVSVIRPIEDLVEPEPEPIVEPVPPPRRRSFIDRFRRLR